jgi:hypothetical protein
MSGDPSPSRARDPADFGFDVAVVVELEPAHAGWAVVESEELVAG